MMSDHDSSAGMLENIEVFLWYLFNLQLFPVINYTRVIFSRVAKLIGLGSQVFILNFGLIFPCLPVSLSPHK